MNTIAVSQLRADLPNFVKLVANNLERLIVTVSGKPKVVLLSVEELESIEETAKVMATVDMKALKKSEEQIENGEVIAFEDLLL